MGQVEKYCIGNGQKTAFFNLTHKITYTIWCM